MLSLFQTIYADTYTRNTFDCLCQMLSLQENGKIKKETSCSKFYKKELGKAIYRMRKMKMLDSVTYRYRKREEGKEGRDQCGAMKDHKEVINNKRQWDPTIYRERERPLRKTERELVVLTGGAGYDTSYHSEQETFPQNR